MKFKRLLGIGMAAAMCIAAAGCGTQTQSTDGEQTSQAEAEAQSAEADTNLEGAVTMNGSTSMEKLVSALDEGFMAKYPKATATAEFTGSGSGIEAVANGTVDIGNSSRALKDEEKAKGLIENVVAIDGIGVIANNATAIDNLTKQQLTDIYNGTITSWKEVGGADEPIVVIGREASSGTRSAFEELLDLADKCKYAQEIDSTGAVMAKVASTPGSIGYVSLDVIDDTVKAMKIDGVEATADNIKAGTYALQRPFVMATRGEISAQSEAVQKFFEYINSDEGQQIIAQVGLISAK